MKQYELLWIPVPDGQVAEHFDPLGEPVIGVENRIVLTIEEAHDLFIAGMRRQRWVRETLDGELVPEHPDFKSYIQSKGIELP